MDKFKKKPLKFSNGSRAKEMRALSLEQRRISKKHLRLSALRHIDEAELEDSVFLPTVKTAEVSAAVNTSNKIDKESKKVPSRLEMLRKWKEEKELKKKMEAQSRKQPFVITAAAKKLANSVSKLFKPKDGFKPPQGPAKPTVKSIPQPKAQLTQKNTIAVKPPVSAGLRQPTSWQSRQATSNQSRQPTSNQSRQPSSNQSRQLTSNQSRQPISNQSRQPTSNQTRQPTLNQSRQPTSNHSRYGQQEMKRPACLPAAATQKSSQVVKSQPLFKKPLPKSPRVPSTKANSSNSTMSAGKDLNKTVCSLPANSTIPKYKSVPQFAPKTCASSSREKKEPTSQVQKPKSEDKTSRKSSFAPDDFVFRPPTNLREMIFHSHDAFAPEKRMLADLKWTPMKKDIIASMLGTENSAKEEHCTNASESSTKVSNISDNLKENASVRIIHENNPESLTPTNVSEESPESAAKELPEAISNLDTDNLSLKEKNEGLLSTTEKQGTILETALDSQNVSIDEKSELVAASVDVEASKEQIQGLPSKAEKSEEETAFSEAALDSEITLINENASEPITIGMNVEKSEEQNGLDLKGTESAWSCGTAGIFMKSDIASVPGAWERRSVLEPEDSISSTFVDGCFLTPEKVLTPRRSQRLAARLVANSDTESPISCSSAGVATTPQLHLVEKFRSLHLLSNSADVSSETPTKVPNGDNGKGLVLPTKVLPDRKSRPRFSNAMKANGNSDLQTINELNEIEHVSTKSPMLNADGQSLIHKQHRNRKVSLLGSPQTRSNTRKSIKGDLITFSPVE